MFNTWCIRELYLGLSHSEGVTLIRQQSVLFTASTQRHETGINTSSVVPLVKKTPLLFCKQNILLTACFFELKIHSNNICSWLEKKKKKKSPIGVNRLNCNCTASWKTNTLLCYQDNWDNVIPAALSGLLLATICVTSLRVDRKAWMHRFILQPIVGWR